MGESWRPQYEAIGLVPGDVAIFTIPVSLFCAGLSAFEGARRYGLVPIFTGVSAKDLIVRMIGEHRAAYLYGTESFLLQLAGVAREMGVAGAWRGHLKGVQTVGASPQLLAACEEVFGAPLFEVYGCTQAAAKIATTCALGAAHGTTHFHDEHLFIELRHPETGELVTEGPADIIVSTPYREASPVFRFDVRDRVDVVPAGSCPCGDPRPGFRPGTLRRSDSMMKIRGVNVWPDAVERLLLAHPEVRDFRAAVRRRQDGADELEIRVAPRRGEAIAPALLHALADEVRAATMVRPHLLVDGAITEMAGAYKVRRWSDERLRFETASGRGGDGPR
jgi:phenylacetate-CoA ligase